MWDVGYGKDVRCGMWAMERVGGLGCTKDLKYDMWSVGGTWGVGC